MSLRETLRSYNDRLDSITTELRNDFQRLNDKLSELELGEDVSEELSLLDQKIKALEGLDQPNPEETVDE